MDNKESVLDALTEFDRKPTKEITPILDEYLKSIAKTGNTLFPWLKLKPLFLYKMEESMTKFHQDVPMENVTPCPNVENVKFTEIKERLINAVNNFNGAPFTIQRLCELVTNPKQHYKRPDKFVRGIEKNINVVSSVDPSGNKIVNESKISLVNGLDNGHPDDSTSNNNGVHSHS